MFFSMLFLFCLSVGKIRALPVIVDPVEQVDFTHRQLWGNWGSAFWDAWNLFVEDSNNKSDSKTENTSTKQETRFTKLATFGGEDGTTFDWDETDDPVMGGSSNGDFYIDKEQQIAVFEGTVRIVSFLDAPGFSKATTKDISSYEFNDVSSHFDNLNGNWILRVRSTTPTYDGFKTAFSVRDLKNTHMFGDASFKAPFFLEDTQDWQTVKISFSEFSYDWSEYTGDCFTQDPTGQQHYCCGTGGDDALEKTDVCTTSEYLSQITGVEIWSEGAEGEFHLEIDWIGAGDADY